MRCVTSFGNNNPTGKKNDSRKDKFQRFQNREQLWILIILLTNLIGTGVLLALDIEWSIMALFQGIAYFGFVVDFVWMYQKEKQAEIVSVLQKLAVSGVLFAVGHVFVSGLPQYALQAGSIFLVRDYCAMGLPQYNWLRKIDWTSSALTYRTSDPPKSNQKLPSLPFPSLTSTHPTLPHSL